MVNPFLQARKGVVSMHATAYLALPVWAATAILAQVEIAGPWQTLLTNLGANAVLVVFLIWLVQRQFTAQDKLVEAFRQEAAAERQVCEKRHDESIEALKAQQTEIKEINETIRAALEVRQQLSFRRGTNNANG